MESISLTINFPNLSLHLRSRCILHKLNCKTSDHCIDIQAISVSKWWITYLTSQWKQKLKVIKIHLMEKNFSSATLTGENECDFLLLTSLTLQQARLTPWLYCNAIQWNYRPNSSSRNWTIYLICIKFTMLNLLQLHFDLLLTSINGVNGHWTYMDWVRSVASDQIAIKSCCVAGFT